MSEFLVPKNSLDEFLVPKNSLDEFLVPKNQTCLEAIWRISGTKKYDFGLFWGIFATFLQK